MHNLTHIHTCTHECSNTYTYTFFSVYCLQMTQSCLQVRRCSFREDKFSGPHKNCFIKVQKYSTDCILTICLACNSEKHSSPCFHVLCPSARGQSLLLFTSCPRGPCSPCTSAGKWSKSCPIQQLGARPLSGKMGNLWAQGRAGLCPGSDSGLTQAPTVLPWQGSCVHLKKR